MADNFLALISSVSLIGTHRKMVSSGLATTMDTASLRKSRGRLFDLMKKEAAYKAGRLLGLNAAHSADEPGSGGATSTGPGQFSGGGPATVGGTGLRGQQARERAALAEMEYRQVVRMVQNSAKELPKPPPEFSLWPLEFSQDGDTTAIGGYSHTPKTYAMHFVACQSLDCRDTTSLALKKLEDQMALEEAEERNSGSADGEDSKLSAQPKTPKNNPMLCSKQHATILKERVYEVECAEQGIRPNSGVSRLLLSCDPCLCWLEEVSFRDLFLGDRGVQGLLPLLKYSRNLRSLNLAGNGLRKDGLLAVVGALRDPDSHNSLCCLELSQNPVHNHCFDGLLGLCTNKENILMLGCVGTNLPPLARARLLKRTMQNFQAADLSEQEKAFRYAESSGESFSDRELFHTCRTRLQEARLEKLQEEQARNVVAMLSGGSPTSPRSGSPLAVGGGAGTGIGRGGGGSTSKLAGLLSKRTVRVEGASGEDDNSEGLAAEDKGAESPPSPIARTGQRSGTPIPR